MPSPLVLLIAGIAFLATLGGLYYKVSHDGEQRGELIGRKAVQDDWNSANAIADKRARKQEAQDKEAKEKADAAHQVALDRLNASVAKLRHESDTRITHFLPPAAASTASDDTACFDRPLYLGAYGGLVKGLRGLADEGSKAVTGLATAQKWAMELRR